jgi:TolB-like protein/DNA-binding winged helix-turn-helix (wHTH) protein
MSASRAYSFGEYTLDLRRGALLRNGADVRLRPKSYEVLRYLVEHHGQLVTKDELLEGVWGRAVVTDASITQCLIEIRRAIGDESQKHIRTVQRRGYIFDLPVSEVEAPAPCPTVEPSPPPDPDASAPTRLGMRRGVQLAIGLLVIALVVVWGWTRTRQSGVGPIATSSTSGRSIAVLPFVDLSPAKDQQYLADGIAEEILDRLARVPTLRVIARTSAFSFRDQPVDVPTIAAKLQVSHVLEGSVRRSGDHVRVTAQLVDVSNDSHLWSKTYDRELGDLFAVQDEIATSVARELETSLAGPASHGSPPAQGAAYERYLQGQFFLARHSPGDVERAVKYFEEAVAIDPGFAPAWAALSGGYSLIAWESDPSSDWRARQGEAARRAVELEPALLDGHLRLAQYYYESGRHSEALTEYRKASELNPDDPWLARVSEGFPNWLDDDLASILEDSRKSVGRDPLSPVAHKNLGLALFASDQFDQAMIELRRALDLNPNLGADTEIEVGRVFVAQRRYPEARAQFTQLPKGEFQDAGIALLFDSPDDWQDAEAALGRLVGGSGDYMHDLRVAEAWALRGRDDEAFRWLRHARDGLEAGPELAARIWWLQNEMFMSPFLKPLHADPRWAVLMATPG